MVNPEDESQGSVSREKPLYFEETLIDKSAEFERERLKQPSPTEANEAEQELVLLATPPEVPPPANQNQNARLPPANQNQNVFPPPINQDQILVVRRPLAHTEASQSSQSSNMKIVLHSKGPQQQRRDPHEEVYDVYGFPLKGKGEFRPGKGKWSDIEDEESDYWYSRLGFCDVLMA